MGGNERAELLYGGKSQLLSCFAWSPAAYAIQLLCHRQPWLSSVSSWLSDSILTDLLEAAMEIPGPWAFHLRNPRNPKVNQTHAGVLEFIADEGIVHLPAWVCHVAHQHLYDLP